MKQKNIPWLGAFISSLYTALPALSIINFFLIVIAVYEPVRDFVIPLLPWFNFTWFMIGIGLITLVATLVMYLIVVPSLNTFNFNQMNKFDSPVMKKLTALEKAMEKSGIDTNHQDKVEKIAETQG